MAKTIELDTKKLDRLIKAVGEAEAKTYVIHDGVEYGIHQEFSTASGGNPQTTRKGRKGTTGKGHPSLLPAFEKHTKLLPKAIGQAIERGGSPDDVLAATAFNVAADWAADVNVDTGTYKNSISVTVE